MRYLVGIDEAGRGPLAGPVCVGVCVAPFDFDFSIFGAVKDSKQLSEVQREVRLARMQKEKDIRYATALVGAVYIDAHGIVHAVRTAMRRALDKLALTSKDCVVLLDGGLHAPDTYVHQKTIVRGDATEPVIALASIAAKVRRDKYMIRIAKRYPEYGFEIHKGYGTRLHRERIVLYGVSALHRGTFLKRICV